MEHLGKKHASAFISLTILSHNLEKNIHHFSFHSHTVKSESFTLEIILFKKEKYFKTLIAI